MKKLAYAHPGDGNGHPPGLVLTWDTVRGAAALVAILAAVVTFGADWSPRTTDRKIRALEAKLEAESKLTDERFLANANTRNLLMEQIQKRFDAIETKLDMILAREGKR